MRFFLFLFLMITPVVFADNYSQELDDAFKYGTYNSKVKQYSNWNEGYAREGIVPANRKRYTPEKLDDDVKILNYDEYNPKHQKATQEELDKLRKYYRHVQLKNKVPQLNYIALKYIYALPTTVSGYLDKLSGSTVVQNTAINVFKQMSSTNPNDLLLDERSLGMGISYGKRLSFRTHSEWDVIFYQKSFVYTETASTGIVVKYDYIDGDGKTQTSTLTYQNLEYIQRNIAITYNRQFDFLSFFGESSNENVAKFTPYVMLGCGAISRWNLLRLSAGILGASSGDGLQTNEQMFNFQPVFTFGAGMKWKISDSIYLDGQFKSLQPTNDINFQNYIASAGLRIYF